jgi:hypothetical protein
MQVEVEIVAHALPHSIRITIPAMVMVAVYQVVLIANGIVQKHHSPTVCTLDSGDRLLLVHFRTMHGVVTCSRDPAARVNP